MPTAHESIDAAIDLANASLKRVAKIKTAQVRGLDEIAALKATAQTWFHSHKPPVVIGAPSVDLSAVDDCFTRILDATERHASKSTYSGALKDAKSALISVRTAALVATVAAQSVQTDDIAPDFSPLAGNPQMQEILTRRWNECAKCVNADAHLAAIVMMGGLLEALFVARANKMPDKTPLITAASAPRDKVTGKATNYQDWMLDSYIKVGFELKWITESAKDLSNRLKEYRNFVHPEKELRYGVTLGLNDSSMFWQVTKALTRQLLLSA